MPRIEKFDPKKPFTVVALYRPKKGKAAALARVLATHVPNLRRWGLATKRPSTMLRAKDGTVIEIFEWKSVKATGDAHGDLRVLRMWKEFDRVCDYVPLASLKEAKDLFAGFERIQ